MNIFEEAKTDGWKYLTVKSSMDVYDMSISCYGLKFICSDCTRKYGSYTGGVTDHFKESKVCGWCSNERICAPVQFAGWPDHLEDPPISNDKVEIIY